MSYNDYDYDPEEELDSRLSEDLPEPKPTPPSNMTLSVQVGLTEYSPNGLMEFIARGLLTQIGGKDQWAKTLEHYLLKLGKEKAEDLINTEVSRIFQEGITGLDFTSLVRKSAEEWINEKVDNEGRADRHYAKTTRKEWMVNKLVKESMDAAFKQAESEWREQTTKAIRETLSFTLAERLSKHLPIPPELKG